MSESKDKKKKRKGSGSSLADAIGAALAQVDQKDGKPAEGAKPAEAPKPEAAKPADAKPAEKAPEAKPVETKPAETKPAAKADADEPTLEVSEPPKEAVVSTVVQRTVAVAPGDSDDPVVTSHAEPVADAVAVALAPAPAAVGTPTEKPAETPTDPPRPATDDATTAKHAAAPVETISSGPGIRVRYFGRTDVGLVREHNEDNFMVADLTAQRRGVGPTILETKIQDNGCVFAVCDGMGGAAAGEVASQMAVDTIHEIMQAGGKPRDRDSFARRLVRSIEEAGGRIFAAAKMDRSRRGMGTTSTVAGLVDNMLFVGQVGDSRAYVLRGEQFALVSKDQSLVNQLIEAGQLTEEEAEAFEHSNIILQALGTTEEVAVDLTFLELRRGDRLLLCSDGLSGLVHGDMIKEVLSSQKNLVDAAAQLISMANAGGGHDNITVVLVDFEGEDLKEPTPDARVAYQQYPLPPEPKSEEGSSPRQTHMKSGGPKPGADVKGDPGSPAVVSADGGGRSWLPLVLVGAVIVLVLVAVFFASSGSGEAPTETAPRGSTTRDEHLAPMRATRTTARAEEARGTVELHTDGAETATLWINDEASGNAADGREIELAPGAYRLRVTAGAAPGAPRIAEASVTLHAGGHAVAELVSAEIDDGLEPPSDEAPSEAPVEAPTEAPSTPPAPATAP